MKYSSKSESESQREIPDFIFCCQFTYVSLIFAIAKCLCFEDTQSHLDVELLTYIYVKQTDNHI
jgi:hypothetical protein